MSQADVAYHLFKLLKVEYTNNTRTQYAMMPLLNILPRNENDVFKKEDEKTKETKNTEMIIENNK